MITCPCPVSKRKNWSLSRWTSKPISSLGNRDMSTSCECSAVYKTFLKSVFSSVNFSILSLNPFFISFDLCSQVSQPFVLYDQFWFLNQEETFLHLRSL